MPARSRVFVTALALLIADVAGAQFDQYKTPGGPTGRPESRKEALERAMEEARWRLGAVRLDPWLSLSDVEWVDNATATAAGESETSDVTATLGAGLSAYLRTGPDLVWAAHALPEYVGWRELEDRRGVGGRYGLAAFGFWNRLTVQAGARRDERQGIVTPEVPRLVTQRNDRGGAALELRLSQHVGAFAAGEALAFRSTLERDEPDVADLERLDRDQTVLRAGVRWLLPRGWSVGLGAERTDVEFLDPAADRSNSGSAPLFELRRDAEDHHLRLELASRSLEPEPGSEFVPFDETSAELEAGFNTDGRVELWLYGGRRLVYSLSEDYSHFRDDRAGASIELELGWRTALRLFTEAGRGDYTPISTAVPQRDDDVLAVGAELSFGLVRGTQLSLKARHLEVDSSLPGFDRSLTTLGAGFAFGRGGPVW